MCVCACLLVEVKVVCVWQAWLHAQMNPHTTLWYKLVFQFDDQTF